LADLQVIVERSNSARTPHSIFTLCQSTVVGVFCLVTHHDFEPHPLFFRRYLRSTSVQSVPLPLRYSASLPLFQPLLACTCVAADSTVPARAPIIVHPRRPVSINVHQRPDQQRVLLQCNIRPAHARPIGDLRRCCALKIWPYSIWTPYRCPPSKAR